MSSFIDSLKVDKAPQTKTVVTSMPVELYEQLKQIKKDLNISISEVVVRAVALALSSK